MPSERAARIAVGREEIPASIADDDPVVAFLELAHPARWLERLFGRR